MGMGAALKLQPVVDNTYRILAIELTAAAQGIDLLRPLKSSEPIEALHEAFRQRVSVLKEDREMAPDLNAAREFLDDMDAFLEDLL
jgi:histidine ammonia-lyase